MFHIYPIRENGVDPLAPTIFHEQWWLDIATGGRYEVVEVGNNGRRVGWLPYFMRNKFGLTFSLPPRMTPFLGPAVDGGEGDADTQAYNRAIITRELIAKLPSAAIYHYKCDRNVTDVAAFQLERFATSVQFTQELRPQAEDILWKNMRKKKRSQIKRAQDLLTITTIEDPELFWSFYATNVKQRGLRNAYDQSEVVLCIEQCLIRECGRVYAAWDKTDDLVAAIWCVWDSASVYYLMTSRSADAHDGAVSLLLWQAIKEANHRGLTFDFDGFSNNESVAFFAGFGGRLAPRYKATRTSALGRLVWEAREARRATRYLC
jgi:Acetyltransferase (GNAT) domain